MNVAEIIILIGALLVAGIVLGALGIFTFLYMTDRKQKQHPVLRNYPVLGRVRYFFEKIGPEFRQYLFNDDHQGKPFSRLEYQHIVKKAKYKRDVLGFGSERDFQEPGYYIRNSLFPKLTEELAFDREIKSKTERYLLINDPLFTQREEFMEPDESPAYLLNEADSIVIGEQTAAQPFKVKGQIGMSAMSYGSLGSKALTALSEGLGMAKGTWMNTGEGGLSEYHLKGGQDIIMQIGPGKFGVRDLAGHFDWDELLEKSKLPEVKAFELKLGQGAKTRGDILTVKK
ncbi:Glutamate synthase large subunit-like protein YerD [Lentibacillus sp. JNUCC-1]|nr:Glutamate synthase large subunit-like protein YerD [Lentibacillus sp. JNUCC-1]